MALSLPPIVIHGCVLHRLHPQTLASLRVGLHAVPAIKKILVGQHLHARTRKLGNWVREHDYLRKTIVSQCVVGTQPPLIALLHWCHSQTEHSVVAQRLAVPQY
jgi:hypothetical protein